MGRVGLVEGWWTTPTPWCIRLILILHGFHSLVINNLVSSDHTEVSVHVVQCYKFLYLE